MRSAIRLVADVLFGLVEVSVFGALGALAYLVVMAMSQAMKVKR